MGRGGRASPHAASHVCIDERSSFAHTRHRTCALTKWNNFRNGEGGPSRNMLAAKRHAASARGASIVAPSRRPNRPPTPFFLHPQLGQRRSCHQPLIPAPLCLITCTGDGSAGTASLAAGCVGQAGVSKQVCQLFFGQTIRGKCKIAHQRYESL